MNETEQRMKEISEAFYDRQREIMGWRKDGSQPRPLGQEEVDALCRGGESFSEDVEE